MLMTEAEAGANSMQQRWTHDKKFFAGLRTLESDPLNLNKSDKEFHANDDPLFRWMTEKFDAATESSLFMNYVPTNSSCVLTLFSGVQETEEAKSCEIPGL